MIFIKTLNKSKYNILSIVICLILIFAFVFGCVDFARADSDSDISNGSLILQVKRDNYMQEFIWSPSVKGKFCGVVNTSSPQEATLVSLESFNISQILNVYRYGNGDDGHETSSLSSSYAGNLHRISTGRFYDSSIKEFIVSGNFLIFATDNDAYNYLKTGEVNNPIYQPKENIEYDSDIEIPLNLDIRLNGSSDFVPNVKISCNQTEEVENRYLEVQYSIGYKATWTLLGGIGLNIKSKTSPTVYGSIEQLDESFDNGGTSFETIFSMTKISHSVAPDKESFSKYEPTPKVYWSLKEIKNHNSEMKIWCRNRIGNKASKWVMVSGDGYKANFDVVSSDENGNPTDLKDDTANSDSGYGSEYWNNRDTTPQDEYSNVDVKTNLKDLKSNYSSLANFYKELFSFLPAEIWILLIGLVSTMVIIAIIRFVRG